MRKSVFSRVAGLVAAVSCLVMLGAGPAPEEEKLSSWLIAPANEAILKDLARRFEVTHRHGTKWEIYVPAQRASELLKLVPDAELVDADISLSLRTLELFNPAFAGYHSFQEVETLLRTLASEHPEIASLEQYGTSESGRPLYALKLSDNVAQNEDEPELMITSATHGDEIITTEVVLALIQELVAGYGTDTRLTAMVDNHELFFVPMLSSDGFANRSRYVGSVDPNRAYPWPEQTTRHPTACIQKIMDFFNAHDVKGSIDFHAFGQLVMYPWAYTHDPIETADARVMQNLGDRMAEGNNYTVGPIADVIYIAEGSSADYYYWQKSSLSYGIELTTDKAPPTSQIPGVVREAREMTWRFIENF